MLSLSVGKITSISSIMNLLRVTKIWVSDGKLYAKTDSGETAFYPLSKFKSLAKAPASEQKNFIIVDAKNIVWPKLDEEINLEGLFFDNHLCELTPEEDSVIYSPIEETADCVAEPTERRP